MTTKESTRREREHHFSGRDLRAVRERCGYAAREFAAFLKSEGAPIGSLRSIYRLEMMKRVPFRYLDALKRFVGAVRYEHCLNDIIEQDVLRQEKLSARRTAML